MLCSQSSTGESPFKEEGLVYGRTFVRCNICQLGNLTGLLCILFLSKINICAAAAAPFSLIDHCQCIAIYQQLIKWSDCTICGENIAAVCKRKCLVRGRGEREFPFPVIPKNGGLWFPFPNFGNGFFYSLPVPEIWEWIFLFPSRSRTLGMEFSIPVPVPEP